MIAAESFQPGLQLIMEAPDLHKIKFQTVLRGLKSDQYLVLDHPSHKGQPVNLPQETACVVRFIHKGRIIGFRSQVVAALRKPYPLLFLTYPKEVETSKIGRADRYPVNIETTCTPDAGVKSTDKAPQGRMLNISLGGGLIRCPTAFEKGRHIFITINLQEFGRIIDLPVEVKRCETQGEEYLLGVSFSAPEHPGFERVGQFLQRLETLQIRA